MAWAGGLWIAVTKAFLPPPSPYSTMERTLLRLATKELPEQESQALVALLSGRALATVTRVANFWNFVSHMGSGTPANARYQ